jgi:hypothetical protein
MKTTLIILGLLFSQSTIAGENSLDQTDTKKLDLKPKAYYLKAGSLMNSSMGKLSDEKFDSKSDYITDASQEKDYIVNGKVRAPASQSKPAK